MDTERGQAAGERVQNKSFRPAGGAGETNRIQGGQGHMRATLTGLTMAAAVGLAVGLAGPAGGDTNV